jgi:hypothetical protein
MADRLFEKGKEGFLGGTLDWDSQTFSVALMDLDTADVGVKQITSSTNATPIVVTSTAHGFTNGDIVVITAHVTNTAANGVWAIAGVAANTFQLTDPVTGTNVVGNGVGGATGRAVCLGPSASGDNWDDFDGTLVGAKVNLASPTITNGIADAADVTFTSVTGATVEAWAVFRDTGTTTTSTMVAYNDGRQIVTCAATAAASATTLPVERLRGAIPERHRARLLEWCECHAVSFGERGRSHADRYRARGSDHDRLARRLADYWVRSTRYAQWWQHFAGF